LKKYTSQDLAQIELSYPYTGLQMLGVSLDDIIEAIA